MICSNCGTENRPGAKFCTECATPFSTGCPNCGTVNPAGAKFCSECATPLQAGARPATAAGPGAAGEAGAAGARGSAGPAGMADAREGRSGAAGAGGERGANGDSGGPVAERRLVSVLFADLVGFTPFAEERDAEDVRETLSHYFELCSDVIGRYGGSVEKFIGDAVMAVWGAPVAREDDAERAVRAALELVDVVRTLGEGIQARAGVLTGEAAVTIGAVNQGMVAGDLVNTAARLQSAAAPGFVLVGEATQRAASAAISFEPAGEQVLKGKAAPVEAWHAVRVVAERGGRNRSESLEAPFVGRDEELRQLKDLLNATGREGKSRLVSIMGPAGIGKSRLSWEFQKYIDGLVERVWWHAGRSPAYGDGISFWALGEMVRGRAGLAEDDDDATTRERLAATVREHVADETEARWIEAALLALLGRGAGATDAAIGSDQLFAAWRTFFERMAATSPVVLAFEDLHNADTGLLDFIDHLMEWSRAVPIVVITLARPELLERRPDWGAGKRSFTSIHLEPLPAEDMHLLLVGLVPGLPREAADRIVARADGIPLYAVETVRMLLARGQLVQAGEVYEPTDDLDATAIPETLTALIAARLDGLDATDRTLIEDAAVLGQSFSVAALAAVSGQPVEGIEARLKTLVRRELVAQDIDPRSPERGQYAFVQALIREVAYNTLSKRERKARHLAAARHFESLGMDELAGGLASHYLAAQRLAADAAEANALAAQARVALRAAAERAQALGSWEQSRLFLEQALEVTSDPAERAELHERAWRAAEQELNRVAVIPHAAAAEAERRKTGDRQAMAVAAANHALAYELAASDPVTALPMARAAWDEFSDLEETPAGIALMSTLMRINRAVGDPATSLVWNDRYLPLAERIGTLEQIATGILGRGLGLVNTGQPRQGLILLRGAHQLAIANDLRDTELGCRILLTFYEQWGEPAAGVALGLEGLEIGRRLGSRAYQFLMVGNTCICSMRTGEWDRVEALLAEWPDVLEDSLPAVEFRIDRAILWAHRGDDPTTDIDEASRRRAAMTNPQFESYELYARAFWALATGDLERAIELAERAATQTDYFEPLASPLAARAALWAGDAATARRVIDRIRESGFWGPVLEADKIRIDAGIAALEGRPVEAMTGFREALRAYRQLGCAFDEAAAVVDLASVLAPADRDTPEVAKLIDGARETLARLGAKPYLERLDAAASGQGAAATLRAEPARQTAAGTPGRATAR